MTCCGKRPYVRGMPPFPISRFVRSPDHSSRMSFLSWCSFWPCLGTSCTPPDLRPSSSLCGVGILNRRISPSGDVGVSDGLPIDPYRMRPMTAIGPDCSNALFVAVPDMFCNLAQFGRPPMIAIFSLLVTPSGFSSQYGHSGSTDQIPDVGN